jgi:hypothetical protein
LVPPRQPIFTISPPGPHHIIHAESKRAWCELPAQGQCTFNANSTNHVLTLLPSSKMSSDQESSATPLNSREHSQCQSPVIRGQLNSSTILGQILPNQSMNSSRSKSKLNGTSQQLVKQRQQRSLPAVRVRCDEGGSGEGLDEVLFNPSGPHHLSKTVAAVVYHLLEFVCSD